jgi:hypothetical protein
MIRTPKPPSKHALPLPGYVAGDRDSQPNTERVSRQRRLGHGPSNWWAGRRGSVRPVRVLCDPFPEPTPIDWSVIVNVSFLTTGMFGWPAG